MNTTRAHLLGDTVSALLRRERLTVAFVMRVGRLSRLTVEHIRDGKTSEPSRRTLTRLARAFATDPYTLVLDHQKMNTTERELHIAAGYADPTGNEAASMLELLLYYRLGSLDLARSWAGTIDRLAALDADAVRALGLAERGCA
jgi:transcriptional regulator with XRE-family HTH domain